MHCHTHRTTWWAPDPPGRCWKSALPGRWVWIRYLTCCRTSAREEQTICYDGNASRKTDSFSFMFLSKASALSDKGSDGSKLGFSQIPEKLIQGDRFVCRGNKQPPRWEDLASDRWVENSSSILWCLSHVAYSAGRGAVWDWWKKSQSVSTSINDTQVLNRNCVLLMEFLSHWQLPFVIYFFIFYFLNLNMSLSCHVRKWAGRRRSPLHRQECLFSDKD